MYEMNIYLNHQCETYDNGREGGAVRLGTNRADRTLRCITISAAKPVSESRQDDALSNLVFGLKH